MAMLVVDGVTLRDPSEMTWGLQDVSAHDAGRTEDALMHKNRVAQKRKLTCKWNGLRPEEAGPLLRAVNSEYMSVTYFDAMSGTSETRTMYVGDRTAAVKWWHGATGKIYGTVAFDFIER